MAAVTFYNMKLLCYIDDSDFTDYQGIGSDPMYKRYDSVIGVIKNNIDSKYQGLLARPFYDDGIIKWYVDEWKEDPICLNQLSGIDRERYLKIKNETLSHYKEKMHKMSPEEFAILSSALKYVSDDFIYCYDNHIVLVAWGMRPDTSKHEVAGSWIKGLKVDEKIKVEFKCSAHSNFKSPIGKIIYRSKGYHLTQKDLPELVIEEGFEFSSWTPNPIDHEVNSEISFLAEVNKSEHNNLNDSELLKVNFLSNENGAILNNKELSLPKGSKLNESEIPSVLPNDGYKFIKWNPSTDTTLEQDTTFTAEYEPITFSYNFNPGLNGEIIGSSSFTKNSGSKVLESDLPKVQAKKGYKFIGWNVSPLGLAHGDRTFIAQYEKVCPWYKRIWLWFTGKGCLKWLLWLLLFLLILFLLNWIFRGCSEVVPIHDDHHPEQTVIGDDSISEIEKIKDAKGNERDNNGVIKDITDENGKLPKETIIAPITGNDGSLPDVIHNEGIPDVIANRLNIYFEDEEADLNKWAHDFKEVYPSDEYSIIGYDKNVRMIQIQIPEDQRDAVREEIREKIPDQKFFVVDESIITLHGNISKSQNTSNIGWHIKATNLENAWKISEGSPEIVVAIVDDGIDASHPFFQGRFYKAYNIFTQNNSLSIGSGHGTHVAGIAIGSNEYLSKGAAGVAPKCKIMPIQVFDNEICTFSSIASGIMYAIHNGADVVNISIGPSFQGLDQLPISEQQKVAKTYFKNEELVYRHIIKTANEKNVILVFAAGNDNIMTSILPECRHNKNTLNVAAVSPEIKAAKFTNYSEGTNISAPGVDIYSSFPSNSYKLLEGTSMAAPMVTGTVALMKSINKNIKIEEVLHILNISGRQVDQYIPNMVQIDKALRIVKSGDYSVKPESDKMQDIIPEQNNNDYSKLLEELNQLKAQRDSLNKKINNIENKLK